MCHDFVFHDQGHTMRIYLSKSAPWKMDSVTESCRRILPRMPTIISRGVVFIDLKLSMTSTRAPTCSLYLMLCLLARHDRVGSESMRFVTGRSPYKSTERKVCRQRFSSVCSHLEPNCVRQFVERSILDHHVINKRVREYSGFQFCDGEGTQSQHNRIFVVFLSQT